MFKGIRHDDLQRRGSYTAVIYYGTYKTSVVDLLTRSSHCLAQGLVLRYLSYWNERIGDELAAEVYENQELEDAFNSLQQRHFHFATSSTQWTFNGAFGKAAGTPRGSW